MMGKVIMSGIVPQLTVPQVPGIALADIAEGSIVKIKENGVPVEFYVVKHVYESGLNGAGRTLLLRKGCYNKQPWSSDYVDSYISSTIDSWLNSTYKALLDAKCQEAIATTAFYVRASRTSATNISLSRSIFLLAASEVKSLDTEDADYYVPEETMESPLSTVSVWRSAYYQGILTAWWTRSIHLDTDRNYSICVRDKDGSSGPINGDYQSTNNGIRPCFTLPATAIFDEETLVLKGVA